MSGSVVINFTLYQAGWFVCVLGAANQQPWLGVVAMLIIVAWHLKQAIQPIQELALSLVAVVIGGTFDQLMLNQQLVQYQAHGWSELLVPVWMLALWAEFATLLNVSLRWMRGRWLLAVLFGAIGGPLAYMAAELLGAVTLNTMSFGGVPATYLTLSIGWAILTPMLLMLSQQLDGFELSGYRP